MLLLDRSHPHLPKKVGNVVEHVPTGEELPRRTMVPKAGI